MSKNKSNFAEIIDFILWKLEPLGVYTYYSAITGSVYIKFTEEKLGTVRVSDHPGKEKYAYKWNLRVDTTGKSTEMQGHVKRYIYGAEHMDEMCDDIIVMASFKPSKKTPWSKKL